MTLEYLIEKYIEKTGYGMDMWSKEENAVMTTVAEIIEESKVKNLSSNTAVSGRLSSYQKMKQKYEERIRQLTDEIITLVEEKDFTKTTTVKMQWRMRLDIEKAIWMGDATCH